MARPILVEILGDARHFASELDKASGKTKRFGATAKLVGTVAVGALAVGLEESVKAAMDAEKSTERLRQAFINTHLSMRTYSDEIDRAEASGRKLGFTDEQTKDSLGSLLTATGNVKDSMNQLAVAQDLARFKGVSLADATKALTMLHAGSVRALKQLGLQTDKVTEAQDRVKAAFDKHSGAAYEAALADAKVKDKQATLANTLTLVTEKVHGQAKAFGDTAAGQMAQFHAQTEHLKVELGTKLLPALIQIIGALNTLVGWLESANKAMGKIGANKGLLTYLKELDARFPGVAAAARDVANAFMAIAHAIEAMVSAIKSIPSHIHMPSIPNIHVPRLHIPHAGGGPVASGQTYLVGEQGPELFVSGHGGSIVPNRSLGATGGGSRVVQLVLPNGGVVAEWLMPELRRQGKIYDRRNARGAFA